MFNYCLIDVEKVLGVDIQLSANLTACGTSSDKKEGLLGIYGDVYVEDEHEKKKKLNENHLSRKTSSVKKTVY